MEGVPRAGSGRIARIVRSRRKRSGSRSGRESSEAAMRRRIQQQAKREIRLFFARRRSVRRSSFRSPRSRRGPVVRSQFAESVRRLHCQVARRDDVRRRERPISRRVQGRPADERSQPVLGFRRILGHRGRRRPGGGRASDREGPAVRGLLVARRPVRRQDEAVEVRLREAPRRRTSLRRRYGRRRIEDDEVRNRCADRRYSPR
mmetsp:Transcript_6860/g.20504  ORF Transcript_6860/g.20504 Transcript_6860/m.20504 type:complete len:204 (+) Transcript_6860:1434-2045(+)